MNLGFWEMALICIVVFILYGEKFPKVVRKFGRFIRDIKKIWEEEILK